MPQSRWDLAASINNGDRVKILSHSISIDPMSRNIAMQDAPAENMGMSSMIREVQELAEKFKVEEDEQYISPYAQLEKATVLQEAR
jgi:hypothetical protein